MIDVKDDQLDIVAFKVTKQMKREIKILSARTGESMQVILERLITEHLKKVNSKSRPITDED